MSYLNRFLIDEDAQFECVAPLCTSNNIWQVIHETSLSIKWINEIDSKICRSHLIIAGRHHERATEIVTGRYSINTLIKREKGNKPYIIVYKFQDC